MMTPRPRRHQLDAKPEDTTAGIRLRSDPSVVSLLSMYDENGGLPDGAFNSSSPSSAATPKPHKLAPEDLPITTGRAQTRRNGSTLRQLLGTPAPKARDEGTCEGDISWAERFLG